MDRLFHFIKTRPFTFVGTILGILPIPAMVLLMPSRDPLTPLPTLEVLLFGAYFPPLLLTGLLGLVGLILSWGIGLRIPNLIKDILGGGIFLLISFLYWKFIGSLVDRTLRKKQWGLLGVVILIVVLLLRVGMKLRGEFFGIQNLYGP